MKTVFLLFIMCSDVISLTSVSASASQSSTELSVTANFITLKSVKPNERIELILSRPLQDSESRIAIFINTTDVSSLFTRDKLRLRYNAQQWPRPLGQSELSVYLVLKEDQWKELARFPLQVAKESDPTGEDTAARFVKTSFLGSTPAGGPNSEQESAAPATDNKKGKMTWLPSLNIGLKSQPAQSTFPVPFPADDRATFADLTMQASLKSDATYRFFSSQTSFDFAGSSFRQEALRFSTLGNEAPRVDLASYLVQMQIGKVKAQIGHFGYGTQRHLINGFSSRGINITVPLLKHFDFSAAAMNGTQLVGYDNFIGLSRRRHQMLSGTLGIELFPKRPGALRIEVGVLSAYFQPVSGVNRGVITDLQRSRGFSFRLTGTTKDGRLRFDGGFTRSFFDSPGDASLNQGANVVPLSGLARNAHYLEASYDILRGFSITKKRKMNLTVGFREENVAPLYRSLGASTQADKIQYEFTVNGSLDEITAQFGHSNFHDNLRNIPSILRTIIGSTQFSVAAPAKALLNRSTDSVWLPRLGYNLTRVHSFANAIPVNGGFEVDLSSIPDLVGTSQSFTADWQIKRLTVGYNLNRSLQDNQQTGQERSDQSVLVNTARFGVAANSKLNLNVDLSVESSANKLTGRIDRTYRLGPGIVWQLTSTMGLTASLSNTIAGDAANTSRSLNTEFDASWTYRFTAGKEGPRKVAGQFFIRYANSYSHALDRIVFSDSLRKNQRLTANLSFTFF